MYTIQSTAKALLPELATCHMTCFPASLATRLGKQYVQKSLEWFLVNENRFMFHIASEGKVIGYCGGFVPVKAGDGSSSGMLQHAFSKALTGILKQPWLLFHPEVRAHYPFIWRNIRRRITGKLQPAPVKGPSKPFTPFGGLVVIGVHPHWRGKGLAQLLMQEFECRIKQYHQREIVLSVKKDNSRAIKAYENFGWAITEEQPKTYLMKKILS